MNSFSCFILFRSARTSCITSEDPPSVCRQEKSESLIYRHTCLMNYQMSHQTNLMVSGIELWKRKVGKSLKIGKKRIKLDLISYPTFWQKCQNVIKCHKILKCMHFGSGSCIGIFFLNVYNSGTRGHT